MPSQRAPIRDRRELDHPDAVREPFEQVGSGLDRAARLAGAARARDRDQTMILQQRFDFGDGAGAADERRELLGKIVREIVERSQRGKLIEQVGSRERKDVLRPREILEPVCAEIAKDAVGGNLILQQLRSDAQIRICPPCPIATSRAMRLSVGPR